MKKLFLAAILASTAVLSAVSPARAGIITPAFAYMATNTGDFGTLNLTTGAFLLQGNSGLTLAGLAVNNSNLYGVAYNNGSGALYTVNPATGSLTFIGNSGITYDDFGSTSAGLYAVGTDANLYSINPSSGAANLIGAIGVGLSGFRSLSDNGSSLYFSSGGIMYTLSTTTGAASLLGLTGGPQFGAMLFLNGTLYGGQDSPDIRVDTLSQANGNATSGPAVIGTSGQFYGLAPVPEPTTVALLVTGAIVGLAVARRRKA